MHENFTNFQNSKQEESFYCIKVSVMFRLAIKLCVSCLVGFLMSGVTIFANLANEFKHVTCGSAVKLLNPYHNVRLHSHEVKYGSGSGQQSVTGVASQDDINSLWVIKGKIGSPCIRGDPIKCGSTIRFAHQTTKRFLHSHLFSSPLSNNQEVSAFGESGVGDDGDHWSVICSTKYWNRDDKIRLKHTVTKKYLHISGDTFGRPISGQSEVSAIANTEPGNEWKTMEGVFIQTDTEK